MSRPAICAKCGRTVLCEYDGDNYVGYCTCGKVTAFRLCPKDEIPDPAPRTEVVGYEVEWEDDARTETRHGWKSFDTLEDAKSYMQRLAEDHITKVWIRPIDRRVAE